MYNELANESNHSCRKSMNPYIYPITLFLFCFLVDKLFYFSFVRDYFVLWNRFESVAYETRENLFEIYENENSSKQRVVLIGSSRMASFQRSEFETRNNISFYNFCVPFPSVAYQLYILERLLSSSKKPSLILWELDLSLFSEESHNYPFRYSLNYSFFWKYRNFWTKKNWIDFFSKKFFFVKKYPLSFKALIENFQFFSYFRDGQLIKVQKRKVISKMKEIFLELNEFNHGGIQVPVSSEKKPLEQEAKRVWIELFQKDKFPTEQLLFLQEMKKKLEQENIVFFVIIPPHSIEYRNILKTNLQEEFFQTILLKNFSSHQILNFSNFDFCSEFEDPFHLSGTCIRQFSYAVKKEIFRK